MSWFSESVYFGPRIEQYPHFGHNKDFSLNLNNRFQPLLNAFHEGTISDTSNGKILRKRLKMLIWDPSIYPILSILWFSLKTPNRQFKPFLVTIIPQFQKNVMNRFWGELKKSNKLILRKRCYGRTDRAKLGRANRTSRRGKHRNFT